MSVLDRKWREHLYEMDYLQEGIGLRAMAQRDPLVEYQREGFDMFAAMMDGVKEESVGFLFNLEVEVDTEGTIDRRTGRGHAVGRHRHPGVGAGRAGRAGPGRGARRRAEAGRQPAQERAGRARAPATNGASSNGAAQAATSRPSGPRASSGPSNAG